VEAETMVTAAAAGDGVLLERAQPRRRLARVEHARTRAVHGVDVAARERGDSGEAAEEVQRDALAREDRALGAAHPGDDRGRLDDVPVADEGLEANLGIECPERLLDDAEATHDTRLLH